VNPQLATSLYGQQHETDKQYFCIPVFCIPLGAFDYQLWFWIHSKTSLNFICQIKWAFSSKQHNPM